MERHTVPVNITAKAYQVKEFEISVQPGENAPIGYLQRGYCGNAGVMGKPGVVHTALPQNLLL